MTAPGRVLALDWGERRLGAAVSDETRTLATPLATLSARDPEALRGALDRLIQAWKPAEIVVGWPRRLDGSPGTHAGRVEAFATDLRTRLGLPVHLADEALTTEEAYTRLAEAGAGRRKRLAMADRAAAAVLLQDWLDARRAGAGREA